MDQNNFAKPVSLLRQLVTQSDIYIGFFDGKSEKFIKIEEHESSMLSYHYSTISDHSHIKTIYHIFNSFMQSSDYKVVRCSIESYKDDIGHCKITMVKRGKYIYYHCGIVDGIIIAFLNNAPIFCTNEAWEEMVNIDIAQNLDDN